MKLKILKFRSSKSKFNYVTVLLFMIILPSMIYYAIYSSKEPEEYMRVKVPDDKTDCSGPKVPQGFLVWSPACKILDLDPLSKKALKLYKKQNYEPCTNKQPLTEIVQDFVNDTVIVKFHQHLLPLYLYKGQAYYECCYQEIFRSGQNKTADKEFELSKCNQFEYDFELPASMEFILIQCTGMSDEIFKRNKNIIYTNAHALIRRKKTRRKLHSKKQISVLMFGIDSMSRLNLLRAMPNTAQHLYDTGWFELQGYNKMDDNTFPNLMAILTGQNESLSETVCNPTKLGKLDDCQIIWKDFKNNGYVTAYAEDEMSLNTFNYLNKLGFLNQPTDHYHRPFALAAEQYLNIELKNYLTFCLGYQNYVDYIYQYGTDFTKIYQNQSHFGLFWSTTFSHQELSDPSFMDLNIKSYLDRLSEDGILNSSIVVFFSDHGLRFGPVTQLMTGWLEERLPFIFIWLPKWFQNEHPEIVKNLRINRNRLTTPYDLHMTLKHILEISGAKEDFPAAVSCPKCQSIFKEIPWNRSCEDAGIEGHWCTCTPFEDTEKSAKDVQQAIKFTINQINFELKNATKSLCARLIHHKTIIARKYENLGTSATDYLVMFTTKPSDASFEATVRHFSKINKFQILDSVSRTNAYGDQSKCVNDSKLKKFCYCVESNRFNILLSNFLSKF